MTTFVVPQAVPADIPDLPQQNPISVPLAVLESHVCAASETSRYALGGVKFERDGEYVIAIATDGRRMALIKWADDGLVPESIVPLATLRMALPYAKKVRRHVRIEVESDVVTVITADQKVKFCASPIEGRFPKWRDVVPDRNAYVHVYLDSLLLRELARVVSAVNTSKDDRGIVLSIHRDTPAENPVVMSISCDGVSSTGILMPLRYSEDVAATEFIGK